MPRLFAPGRLMTPCRRTGCCIQRPTRHRVADWHARSRVHEAGEGREEEGCIMVQPP